MFLLHCFQQKKQETPVDDFVADDHKQHLSSQTDVAATNVPASEKSADAGKPKKTKWLFGHPEKKGTSPNQDVARKENSPGTSDKMSKQQQSFSQQDSTEMFDFSLPNVTNTEIAKTRVWFEIKCNGATEIFISDFVIKATVDRFGLPNVGQSCFMNSILQSLLGLKDFVRDISCQEHIWSSVPQAQVLRRLMDIRNAHTSTNALIKSIALSLFKEDVSVQAPEFSDWKQKDAHEFLISVLHQMSSLSPLLRQAAESMGSSYTCPVEDHLMFKMENVRVCKSCGAESKQQEAFANLSLDVISGGSVEQMLEQYLMETELEYNCECGGKLSGQRSTFVTLPKVLVLHLKRFSFSPSFKPVKVQDPIVLLKDLVVSSTEDGSCYSLVSIISHFGSTEQGHYICDAVHPDNSPEEPTDRWITYNDAAVSGTTSESVCEQRQKSAYILFYKKCVERKQANNSLTSCTHTHKEQSSL
uniref:ubiquitin carboxyl-terminal hydrolase 37-like isoform X2 n=1 Tax=Monopterus albus TaxID=43700 RepID=UPI0009B3F242|nr:ubiquitin carboxyl-terminal hydrolase 37-like isoform X2 [Monopterus albus]